MLELLTSMASYFDIEEGFTSCIELMKEAQKTAATIDPNLINGHTLLRMGIEAMHDCVLFEHFLMNRRSIKPWIKPRKRSKLTLKKLKISLN